jgi:hypothetical protein
MSSATLRYSLEIDFLILHQTPQALDHDVVHGPSPAIHADSDIVVLEPPGKGFASILRALVGIENLRMRVAPQGTL